MLNIGLTFLAEIKTQTYAAYLQRLVLIIFTSLRSDFMQINIVSVKKLMFLLVLFS